VDFQEVPVAVPVVDCQAAQAVRVVAPKWVVLVPAQVVQEWVVLVPERVVPVPERVVPAQERVVLVPVPVVDFRVAEIISASSTCTLRRLIIEE